MPLYDNEDSVCGILYNNVPYYFLKNLQGDIIAITDRNGTVVAEYGYDAWGLCTVVKDSSECHIATINPYRYKGYYYDAETNCYYIQSRYYDPCLGRFINSEEATVIASPLNFQYNGFVFCENNPVNGFDYNGFISIRATAMVICALTGAISALSTACKIINQSIMV